MMSCTLLVGDLSGICQTLDNEMNFFYSCGNCIIVCCVCDRYVSGFVFVSEPEGSCVSHP